MSPDPIDSIHPEPGDLDPSRHDLSSGEDAARHVVNESMARALDACRDWLEDHGATPHPLLPEAVGFVLVTRVAQAAAENARLEGEDSDPAPLAEQLLGELSAEKREELQIAIRQFQRFVSGRFETPERFLQFLEIGEPS